VTSTSTETSRVLLLMISYILIAEIERERGSFNCLSRGFAVWGDSMGGSLTSDMTIFLDLGFDLVGRRDIGLFWRTYK